MRLDPVLVKGVRSQALKERRSITEVLERAIQEYLERLTLGVNDGR